MVSSFFTKIPSLSAIFSIYTSLSAFTIVFRTILHEILPAKIRHFIVSKFTDYFSSYFNPNFTFIIEEQSDYVTNQTFRAAQVYLPTLLTRISTGSLLVSSSNLKDPMAKPKFGIPVKAKITDDFEGIPLEWTLLSDRDNNPHQKYQKRWESAIFQHHTTFETLAMEPELKNTLIRDLDAFSSGKDFYKSVGRAWKRGYLLYGPPGTGKSSLVAAIANHMNFNIYDLQIQSVKHDEMLRQILTMTENRSILLMEDLDCSGADARDEDKEDDENQDMKKKKDPKVTLSGLLNFVDGLWSSCVEERIIIFTTNHKEKLDPALLRPGRMDVHILMDYCTPVVFKKLAALYLETEDHNLFEPLEKMFLEVKATPAEITEQLMASKNPDVALKGLIEFLERKKMTKESVDFDIKEAEA
ncbi:hypothetical protein CARUB_v10003040mg [Capsella rubella]|uniref:AAA+ ATPase domain-containing protein n=1 Tax=Capsella rubella TaxID=81985 RepID=R0GZP0_9BRAS|nr:hypothetical protein CARUB_v10003040mg [Capsella rubella]